MSWNGRAYTGGRPEMQGQAAAQGAPPPPAQTRLKPFPGPHGIVPQRSAATSPSVRGRQPGVRSEMETIMAGAFSVLVREDTLFGACFALGEDFGFSPTYLRILFALLFFWNPVTAAAAYGACLAVVVFSRWAVPEPVPAQTEVSDAADDAANEDERQQALPLAA